MADKRPILDKEEKLCYNRRTDVHEMRLATILWRIFRYACAELEKEFGLKPKDPR